jgi:hypothetical protein
MMINTSRKKEEGLNSRRKTGILVGDVVRGGAVG